MLDPVFKCPDPHDMTLFQENATKKKKKPNKNQPMTGFANSLHLVG